MIITWFGRAFGRNGAADEVAETLTAEGLAQVAAAASSIVDSDDVSAELARARRYEHDLAIAVLDARPAEPQNADRRTAPAGSRLPQMVALLTAVALRDVLRSSDVVCYHAAENRFVLALPESDSDHAMVALTRVRAHLHERLRLLTEVGVASFPSDALTLDELVATAAGSATSGPLRTSSISAPAAANGNGRGASMDHRRGPRRARRRADAPSSDPVTLGREGTR